MERKMRKVHAVTLAFLVIGCVALVSALLVGIDDNPPGLLLVYGAVACVILASAHRWHRPRSFFLLLGLSFLGFIVFVVLHNVFYVIGESNTASWVASLMEVLHVVSFYVAVLVCPAGILVGLIGYFVARFRGRKGQAQVPST